MKNLISEWKKAKEDLGLELVFNFSFGSANEMEDETIFLLKNFGAKKGMLITSDYKNIENYIEIIIKNGFGYSVLREPLDDEYRRADILYLLCDWGWSGKKEHKPSWLVCEDEEE